MAEPPRFSRDFDPAAALRIYIGESDKYQGKPLYESIVLKAREMGLAGATVLRSPLGFGASSHLHTSKILRLSEDLPIVIEIVDQREHLDAFIPQIKKMVKGGLVTWRDVEVLHYDSAGE